MNWLRRAWHQIIGTCDRVVILVQWVPVIWRNAFDFDQSYLYDIMAYKLRRMARHHRRFGIGADRDAVAEECDLAAACFERLVDNDWPKSVWGGEYYRWAIRQLAHGSHPTLQFACRLLARKSTTWWD